MEWWISKTANVKKDALTIFLIRSLIGSCAEMRKLERVMEFRLFISYASCLGDLLTSTDSARNKHGNN